MPGPAGDFAAGCQRVRMLEPKGPLADGLSGRGGCRMHTPIQGLDTSSCDAFPDLADPGCGQPALVGLPVTWAATDLARVARRWFRRLRRSDGLGMIVRAAAGGDIGLSNAEFDAVQRLLEQESTWVLAGRGTVEDLAARIALCLPDRGEVASLAAGRAIAAGLLEFAVHDLEPEWFQRVLFARLDRLENRQASALDEAMLSVHADLAALLALQGEAE